MSAALVPVKNVARAKSRLGAAFSRADLEALSLAMLRDIVEILVACAHIDRVAVVTPDPQVGEVAREAGGLALVGEDSGLNESLDRGAAELGLAPGEPLLVVLGDVPGIRAADLDALHHALSDLGDSGVVIAPSNDGGTAALLRAPADVIPSRFGPGSATLHREAADRADVPCCEIELAGLAVDLDLPADVRQFMASDSGGPHTRALLDRIDFASENQP